MKRVVRSACALVAAAAMCTAVPAGMASADPIGPTAQVWITTPDHTQLLHDAGTVAFSAARRSRDRHGRPEPPLPDDDGIRRLADRLVGNGAGRAPAVAPETPRCATCSTRAPVTA